MNLYKIFKIKTILLAIAIFFFVFFSSCLKKHDDPKPHESTDIPEITNVNRSIEIPRPGDLVTVTATVTAPSDVPVSVVRLKWTLNGANPSEVTMSKSSNSDVYTGSIPAQNEGVSVEYTVVAFNKNGTSEKRGNYRVTALPIEISDDCTYLSLNEINGNGDNQDRYIELYNSATNTAIRLDGVTIYYNNLSSEPVESWKGSEGEMIYPKSVFLLKGTKGAGDLSTGLSSTQGIIIEMVDKTGKRIDIFKIEEDPYRENSYSRIPDGTGKWYLTYFAGSPGVVNGEHSFGATQIPSSPIITDFTRDILMPSTTNATKVSATVRAFGGTTVSSVILKYSVGGVAQADINTTGNNDIFTASIPAQPAASIVEYKMVATNNENEKDEVTSSYAVMPVGGFDYSKLKLNEISGVGKDNEKFYELINTGSETISLADCKIEYNANGSSDGAFPPNGYQGVTWTGASTQMIEAGKLFCIIGRDAPGSFTTGLSPQRILIITLKDPFGKVIDQCIRAEDIGEYAIGDKSFSRIPDGTGPFYFTSPTPCTENGSSTSGLLLVPETRTDTPPDTDYTHLVLNEISGEHKFVEIYNAGNETISLHGVRLQRNNGSSAGGSEWIGKKGDVIPAKAYRIVTFNNYQLPDNWTIVPEVLGSINSGISDQQILKVAIVAPSGNPVDVFIRGNVPLPAWQTTDNVTRNRSHSYSRMTDNRWAYAFPTPGAENGTKMGDIINPGYLTAQP